MNYRKKIKIWFSVIKSFLITFWGINGRLLSSEETVDELLKKRSDKQHNTSVAEKSGSYTTTYKADYKPQQHKAEYKNFEDYLAAQQAKSEQ